MIVSAVCATSQRARDINIPVTRPFRKPGPAHCSLRSLFGTDGESILAEAVSGISSRHFVPNSNSTKSFRRSQFALIPHGTDLALHVHVSKGHIYRFLKSPRHERGVRERDRETKKRCRRSRILFAKFFPFPFLSYIFFLSYTYIVCAYSSTLSCMDLSNCSNSTYRLSDIERETL